MQETKPAKDLMLILARELATNTSTPMFITDNEGTLVFYNEPAERILGRPFAAAGEIVASEWEETFEVETLDGKPMPLEEMPSGVAFLEKRAASGPLRSRTFDEQEARARDDRLSALQAGTRLRRHRRPLLGVAQVRVTIWGCRGSLATPGRATLKFGGNTSCVSAELDDGTLIVFDAGTGIRNLGLELAGRGPREIHLCLTHFHLDHVEGIGFFAPLFDSRTELHIWGPPSPSAASSSGSGFPFPAGVPALALRHPGAAPLPRRPRGAVEDRQRRGLRHGGVPSRHDRRLPADRERRRLRLSPDHEPAVGIPPRDALARLDVRVRDRVRGDEALVHDAQYSEDEYPSKIGWGHSSVADAVVFANRATVHRLFLFHHDPLHDDRALDELQERAPRAVAGRRRGARPRSRGDGDRALSASSWTAYDEGYLQAYQWAGALAGGAALPQEAAPIQLGPGEVAHSHFAPVGVSGFFGEDKRFRRSFLLARRAGRPRR